MIRKTLGPSVLSDEMVHALMDLSTGETSHGSSLIRGRSDRNFIDIQSNNPDLRYTFTLRRLYNMIHIHDNLDGLDYYIIVLDHQDELPPGTESYEHGFSYDYRIEWLLKKMYEPELGGLNYYRLYLFGWPKVTHSHT